LPVLHKVCTFHVPMVISCVASFSMFHVDVGGGVPVANLPKRIKYEKQNSTVNALNN